MTQDFVVRRRRRRSSPMSRHRIGGAAAAGAGGGVVEFPGLNVPDRKPDRATYVTGSLAFFLHAAAVGGLLLAAYLSPEIQEEILELQLIREPPAEKTDPAPARRVIAERRSTNYAPQAQAVKPDVMNPRVVAQRSSIRAESLDLEAVGTVVAPKQVARARVVTERVTAFDTVAATPTNVDVTSDTAPSLRSTSVTGPAGPSVGPRQIVAKGDTIGTGPTVILGIGSSVKDGIDSNRDVLGSPTGPRLGNVNTAVGEGYLDGSGGTGEGGVALGDCFKRPEVQAYLGDVRARIYARWALPPGVQPNQEVVLRFQLDPAGSAKTVEVVDSKNKALGESAVDALRSASPFPAMSNRVRCLARLPISGTFRNPLGS